MLLTADITGRKCRHRRRFYCASIISNTISYNDNKLRKRHFTVARLSLIELKERTKPELLARQLTQCSNNAYNYM